MISRPRKPQWPRPLTSVGATLGAAVALAPSSLPRAAWVAGLLVMAGADLGALIGRCAGARLRGTAGSRRLTGWICAGLATGLLAQMLWWQSTLRAHLGMSPLDVRWILGVLLPPALLAAACYVGNRARMTFAALVAAALLPMMPSPAGASGPAPTPAQKFLTTDATTSSLRIYGELDHRDFSGRAVDAVRRWQEAGGLQRRAVVIAVPTGSGWVDPDAVNGFENRFDGDVGLITMQYSDIPSWQAFVSSSRPARDSAIALTNAVIESVARLEARDRPSVYIYGQSLGAIGADAARRWAANNAPRVICHTILAGAPEGSATTAAPGTTVLVNGSDPVSRWSPRVIWQPPRLPARLRSDMPQAPWIPIAGFVQAGADLLGALSYPAGYGHQYGAEQGLLVPDCPKVVGSGGRDLRVYPPEPTKIGQMMGPRAAS